MNQRGILIVVSGFAGTGKGTIMKNLLSKYSEQYALSISMTTRKPRPGEQEGVEYFFTDKEHFEEKIRQDGLIEYACYVGNYYGTPKDYVERMLEAGRDVILEIEIQGALQVKKKMPGTVLVFVVPPSARILYERLKGRGTETPEVIAQRMSRAVEESQGIGLYDYILINDEIDECVERLHHMIQTEKQKSGRNLDFIKEIQRELVELKEGEF